MSIVSTPRDQAAFELAPYKSLDNAELQAADCRRPRSRWVRG